MSEPQWLEGDDFALEVQDESELEEDPDLLYDGVFDD